MKNADRIAANTIILVFVGAVAGALSGTLCLLLLGFPAIRDWKPAFFFISISFGTYVGAPLGAVCAPILGWLLLRRVPAIRALLYSSLGTLVGSFAALLFGWLFADIGDGIGLFYLTGGAVLGLVLTAFVLRARYRDHSDSSSLENWGSDVGKDACDLEENISA